MTQGTVLVQHFRLANGSFCLKASLGWQGTEATSILSVYETPNLNWKLEAGRIASTWLAGPPAEAVVVPTQEIAAPERMAAAG